MPYNLNIPRILLIKQTSEVNVSILYKSYKP